MSYVIAAPEMMAAAATDLTGIGSTLTAEHTAAAALTVGLVPAAGDEVSAAVTHLFSQHAAGYQAVAAQAAAFREQFVQNLTTGAASYTSAESVITSLLQRLQYGLTQTENKLSEGLVLTQQNFQTEVLGNPIVSAILNTVGGIALLAVWTIGFFGFFLVLVPLGIIAQYLQGVIQGVLGLF